MTSVPIYSNCERNATRNRWPEPALLVAMTAYLFLNPSRQFAVVTDIQVKALVNIGGSPPLYSGAQKTNPSAFSNSALSSLAVSFLVSIPGM